MLLHCLKCKKNTENITSRVSKTRNDKRMLLSNRKQEASGTLSS